MDNLCIKNSLLDFIEKAVFLSNRTISSFIDPAAELQSYFGRAMLNYKDKYLLTATIRADGSSVNPYLKQNTGY